MAKPTILIVDDEKQYADNFAEFLNLSFDCNVLKLQDSTEVEDLLEKQPVHVIFQDIHIPGPDGFEVVKRIKEKGRNMVIYIITSWKEDAYYVKCADLGVKYLHKSAGFKLLTPELVEIFDKIGLEYKKK